VVGDGSSVGNETSLRKRNVNLPSSRGKGELWRRKGGGEGQQVERGKSAPRPRTRTPGEKRETLVAAVKGECTRKGRVGPE